MASKTTFICPYCFEKHKLSGVQFRCTNRRCKDCDDIEMYTVDVNGRFWAEIDYFDDYERILDYVAKQKETE